MRRLMLLRHAKTETDAPSGRDQDRRLDDRGHKDAARIGDWMATHPPFPDTVLVSHAVRARQTWDIAWEAMKDRVPTPQVEILPELYGADPAQILESIRTATAPADPKQLLLVAHNPGMHEAALMLMGGGDPDGARALADNLPTAGLAILDFDVKDWGDVAYRRGKLVLFTSPRLLRSG
ncbi:MULTISPECIES: SixA phosphatase family protein [Bradyrhizobium]|jgi:phosphohistidine phosphatase|uniref:SixA phosphatase family protein n=1 Tax=Bradyrhizobium TaxID=374 RepID=UPI001BA72AEC|nr:MULTISPECIES: histidine phosphatase family protein [Bradyrhizobium]MBR0815157.1 histidine phosphatase family protein [Bradyrhizobium diazoefficiens]WOH76072.1 histidine phosphatase family protein [Bradyrhizobium sp. NDS-1]